ncbi:MAG: type II secretion system F family protein [Planctomycetaceae bacterium]|nr:type II secretion system F family protein [Planctomycetaceae bacterium]
MPSQASIPHIIPQPGFAGILKEDVRFSTGAGDSAGERVNGWFDRLMLQSGIRTAPAVWLLLCCLLGIAFGGAAFVASENLLATALAGMAGMVLPVALASVLRGRRQKKIMEQLPAMAEELARSARTGRNVEHAFRTVAADTPTPLGDELRLAVRRTEMGLDLASAVRDLFDRTGVGTLTMFSSAISVHQETGGDLILVLERLATAVRDRLHFINRLRAATIASRLGALLMLVIPPLVILFFVFTRQNYLADLLGSFWGRLSIGIAVTLQIIGAFFVFRILRQSARF